MRRRNFIKSAGLSAVAISTSGFISFDGKQYVGDCETTSDILGPFYRPDSPVRNDLRIKGQPGELAQLSGFIRHSDCTTPYKNAKVEIWHCDVKGVYDNQSPDFNYRGTTFTNETGFYSFQTILPVAYAGPGFIRPAHFHLIVTAEGYQPLVTQLYFNGDKHIKDDPWASSSHAKKRILEIKKDNKGVIQVRYDVGMSKILHVEAASIDKLTGKYVETKDGEKQIAEIFKYQNKVWKKNEAFGNKFEYVGNNTFEELNNPPNLYWKLEFTFLPSGTIQLTESYTDVDLSKKVFVYTKQ
jgi:catechol 1,2-dioxygenase